MTKFSTPKVASEKARRTRRETAPKLDAKKTRRTHSETNSKVAAEKAHDADRKTASVAVDSHGNPATKVAAEKSHDADRKATTDFEQLRATQVPPSMRALAERNVAQTRELYEGSAKAPETVFESWENSLDAFGQAAVALNRKIIDIAERNISSGFDLATSLARAKNTAEAMEVQIAYCRKQFVELRMQAEEVRVLLQKVTASVVEPIKAQ